MRVKFLLRNGTAWELPPSHSASRPVSRGETNVGWDEKNKLNIKLTAKNH